MKGVDASSGSLQNLQVHHLKLRSRSGDDEEQNLITLCAECHEQVHRKSYPTHVGQRRGHWPTSTEITAAMFERYNKKPSP